jgi:hypothetical protein
MPPSLAIGRAFVDWWLVHMAYASGVVVVDVSEMVLAVHASHGYSHLDHTGDIRSAGSGIGGYDSGSSGGSDGSSSGDDGGSDSGGGSHGGGGGGKSKMNAIRHSEEARVNLQLLLDALRPPAPTSKADDGHDTSPETIERAEFQCEASAERVKKAGVFWSIDHTLVLAARADSAAPQKPLCPSDQDTTSRHPSQPTSSIEFRRRELTASQRLRWHHYERLLCESEAAAAAAAQGGPLGAAHPCGQHRSALAG